MIIWSSFLHRLVVVDGDSTAVVKKKKKKKKIPWDPTARCTEIA